MRLIAIMLAVVAALLGRAAALAAPACDVPAELSARAEGPSAQEPKRLLPIGGYTLALIWLPEHCRRRAGDFDCARGAGKSGFALHGLWPDGQGPIWPQWCAPAAPLPAATLRTHYCATPSAQLTQHEWAKHGTCMAGTTPDRYLALARAQFDRIAIPRRAADWKGNVAAGAVERAFAAANLGLRADMVRLNLNKRGWLEEVWLCLDTRFRPKRCAADNSTSAKRSVRVEAIGGGAGKKAKATKATGAVAFGAAPVSRSASRSPDGGDRGGA